MSTVLAGPRVVVRPPNVPAPPPVSLLTQNNVIDDDRDVIQPDAIQGRWAGGGGTEWLESLRDDAGGEPATATWQTWPDGGGSSTASKDATSTLDPEADARLSAVQRPIGATLILTQGALAEWSLRNAVEGTIEVQMLRAFDAVLPRVIESELWSSAEAETAKWADQFRLKSKGHNERGGVASALPFIRALAAAEQAAADYGFIDQFGGAFIHVSPALYSLFASRAQGLRSAPSGRQVTTSTGCSLVCEPGGTGVWAEGAGTVRDAVPAGAPAGDNLATGWLFVTPPVRVRLSPGGLQTFRSEFAFTNDWTLVGEREFTIEASVPDSRVTSVGIPVDYTQET